MRGSLENRLIEPMPMFFPVILLFMTNDTKGRDIGKQWLPHGKEKINNKGAQTQICKSRNSQRTIKCSPLNSDLERKTGVAPSLLTRLDSEHNPKG